MDAGDENGKPGDQLPFPNDPNGVNNVVSCEFSVSTSLVQLILKKTYVVSCCFICFPNETEHNMCFAGIDD